MNHQPIPRRAGESDSYWHLGNRFSLLVTGDETQGRFATFEIRITRGNEPPRRIHHQEDEIVYVLEGYLTYFVDEEEHEVHAGAALFIPSGVERCFRVDSDEVRLLVTFVPSGFERYLQEVGIPASCGNAEGQARHGEIDVERLVTVAARYGIEITGPPPVDSRALPDDFGGAGE